ncbi:BREX system serine/threonine kinase PglW [bacterium]|nr:BREX system serine/threonine kinase PglW [bacterium]
MSNSNSRWTVVSESEFPWEREALAYIRERLPDGEPFRAWSNFEFIAEDGSLNEVDLLVVSRYKVFLVEIKSRPGLLQGDGGTWTWSLDGKARADDNPLLLADRKSKKLKSLLSRQTALKKVRIPYVDPVIFLSAPDLRCELTETGRTSVFLRAEAQRDGRPSIMEVLKGEVDSRTGLPSPAHWALEAEVSRAFARAMDQAGIRPSQRSRRIGDYLLDQLLLETDAYQDWAAHHVAMPKVLRRVRLYPNALQASELSRVERRQAAEREFLLFDGISYPGILKASDFTEHERGPAVLFEHDPDAQRLDFFLREHLDKLDMGERIRIVRVLAETLQFAHRHRIYHRALSPQTVLVSKPETQDRTLKVFDWQAGKRSSDTLTNQRPTLEGCMHLSLFGDPQSLLYQAPESLAGMAFDGVKLDVFSLGAIAYHVFSGRPPASSLHELQTKCATGNGLRIEDALDGASMELTDLIQFSTSPAVDLRLGSVDEFLDLLYQLEEAITAPDPEAVANPLEAKPGDKLEGGFVVKRPLGKGATSVALWVERDGKEGVLKIALDPAQNDRIRQEGELLKGLRHQHLVALNEVLEISGHAALHLTQSGAGETMAQRLRDEGRLSMDLLERFGEELLLAVAYLEAQGISHRDIKPDNIAIGETRNGRRTLVLFDFSLSGTPVENLRAGTPPYLDPFLRRRTPPRWDLYAERFAAGVTLYEMATGVLPTWGDGQSDPGSLAVEVSLDANLFDPSVREDLADFFAKALHSDYRRRFENAEQMLKAWRRVFEQVDKPTVTTDHDGGFDLDRAIASATLDSPLASLGLSPRILSSLDRLGAATVRQVIALPRIRLYRNKGIGNKTIKDVRDLAERLAKRFPEAVDAEVGASSEDIKTDPRSWSVDRLSRRLVHDRLDDVEIPVLRAILGLDERIGAWLPLGDVAERLAVSRATVESVLERARKRWDDTWMTALRKDVGDILERHGGIMTGEELAAAILTQRGSISEEPVRTRLAVAAIRAALEVETVREKAQVVLYRGKAHLFLAATGDLSPAFADSASARAQYAERLGEKADELAAADPLLTPQRVLEELQAVPVPEAMAKLTPERCLLLARSASRLACLSSRMELYPRGMGADRALRLGAGAIVGPKELTVKQVQDRVMSRYPEAAPLPGRPQLDELIKAAGVEMEWDHVALDGRGAYATRIHLVGASSSTLHRLSTASAHENLPSDEILDARAFETRLERAVTDRRFLLLAIEPKYLLRAEAEITKRFEVHRVSFESLLVRKLRSAAQAVGAKWEVVVSADGTPRDSNAWRNLRGLVKRAMGEVEQELSTSSTPVLMVENALIARYDHMELLERLRDDCARSDSGAPGYLVLIASDDQSTAPKLERQAVPLITASEWVRIPHAWLENRHRSTLVPTP